MDIYVHMCYLGELSREVAEEYNWKANHRKDIYENICAFVMHIDRQIYR